MRDLNFNNIFSNEDIEDYNLFIEKLKSLKNSGYSTKELLLLVYQYYQGYVTYNYDQLQIVKLNRVESDEAGRKCSEAKENINDRIYRINAISQKGELSLKEIVEQFKGQEGRPFTKEEAVKLLDSVFLDIEGRPLTERNKKIVFGNYGKIRHVFYKETKNTGIFKVKEVKEHDEIMGIETPNYPPVYNNQMLIDGVCADYTNFESKICKDLGIGHRKVTGVGTTGHAWSLIYLEDEDSWVHFDMTMVKFYQDNWIKEHEPYSMQDWVLATIDDIFRMQQSRKILSIGDKKCNFSKDNYKDFNVNEYVQKDEIEH